MLLPLWLHKILTGHHSHTGLRPAQLAHVQKEKKAPPSGGHPMSVTSKVGFGILSLVDGTLLNVKASSKSVTSEVNFAVGILQMMGQLGASRPQLGVQLIKRSRRFPV